MSPKFLRSHCPPRGNRASLTSMPITRSSILIISFATVVNRRVGLLRPHGSSAQRRRGSSKCHVHMSVTNNLPRTLGYRQMWSADHQSGSLRFWTWNKRCATSQQPAKRPASQQGLATNPNRNEKPHNNKNKNKQKELLIKKRIDLCANLLIIARYGNALKMPCAQSHARTHWRALMHAALAMAVLQLAIADCQLAIAFLIKDSAHQSRTRAAFSSSQPAVIWYILTFLFMFLCLIRLHSAGL